MKKIASLMILLSAIGMATLSGCQGNTEGGGGEGGETSTSSEGGGEGNGEGG